MKIENNKNNNMYGEIIDKASYNQLESIKYKCKGDVGDE
jgi:hypothetical protein